jgi:hypothetical protein
MPEGLVLGSVAEMTKNGASLPKILSDAIAFIEADGEFMIMASQVERLRSRHIV